MKKKTALNANVGYAMATETARQKKMQAKTNGKIAAKLEITPPEFRAHVYKTLVREKAVRQAEKNKLEKERLTVILKSLKAQVANVTSPDEKKALQSKIRKMNQTLKALRVDSSKGWTPVLPGSFEGGKR